MVGPAIHHSLCSPVSIRCYYAVRRRNRCFEISFNTCCCNDLAKSSVQEVPTSDNDDDTASEKSNADSGVGGGEDFASRLVAFNAKAMEPSRSSSSFRCAVVPVQSATPAPVNVPVRQAPAVPPALPSRPQGPVIPPRPKGYTAREA